MEYCMVTDTRITVPRRLPPTIHWLGDQIDSAGLSNDDLRLMDVYPYQPPQYDPVTHQPGRLTLVADPAGDYVTRQITGALPAYQKVRAEKEIARIDGQAARWVMGLVKLLLDKGLVDKADIPDQVKADYQRRQQLLAILNG